MNVNDEKTLEGWFKIRKDAEYCIEAEDYKKITTKEFICELCLCT